MKLDFECIELYRYSEYPLPKHDNNNYLNYKEHIKLDNPAVATVKREQNQTIFFKIRPN